MKKLHNEVFLVSSEYKDIYCLSPLIDELKKNFHKIHEISLNYINNQLNTGFERALNMFCKADRPLVIFCSPFVLPILGLLRPRDSFDCIGIEHGLAPFKRHTFGRHLLDADYYIAPTRLWAERLQKLFPKQASRVKLGGFPRLEVLREMRDLSATDKISSITTAEKWSASSGKRKLVILSWGTNSKALDLLPDQPNIAYLYHPADTSGLAKRKSKKCSLFISTPELSSKLLACADEVYGDFSSLTLEALALGICVHVFIDRSFFVSDTDLPGAFFDRKSSNFGRIPKTESYFLPEATLNATELSSRLETQENSPGSVCIDDLPNGILPPTDIDNRILCTNAICEIAANLPEKATPYLRLDNRGSDGLFFLLSAYSEVLGRPADLRGLLHYWNIINGSKESEPLMGLWILIALANSEEGRARFAKGHWRWPRFSFSSKEETTDKKTDEVAASSRDSIANGYD